VRGFYPVGGLFTGAEVFWTGVPGQEAFQRGPGERFPTVEAAFVKVSARGAARKGGPYRDSDGP
jgi:hypothetical protein